MKPVLTTQQKALKINLNPAIYGTFAEIGAGQDVAGNFFKAGAASGTVAKSISAYDMVVSDTIYGKEESKRYVCKSRLEKMLKYEHELLIERLSSTTPERSYFAFANTVAARNYHGTNEAHGWLGLRFGSSKQECSEVIIHVRMGDNTAQLQQQAIGVLGVNLSYAAFYHENNLEEFVSMLMHNLSRERIEIDMISTKGSAFKEYDNRLLNLELVKTELTDAIMFDCDGQITLASDELYKKEILVARGSYRPPTKVNLDILKTGVENFKKDTGAKEVVPFCEITIHNLRSGGELAKEDFLARVDLLTSINYRVLITNFPQYFKLTNYLSRFKAKHLAIVLGAYNFKQIFDDDYNQVPGGKLEALGRLFMENVQVYLYPYREELSADELISLKNMPVPENARHLVEHIKALGQVKDLEGYDDSILHIYSRKVLKMIVNDEDGWEDFVPAPIAKTINDKCLFGHPCFYGTKDD
ncbi:MAG: nicotinate-nucleotide adenylyltransferase [Halobacteriovoraceae bacterium]|nr:nicotinate-nucleotide adenylyltransferase [Halobacteriovoraceae bacterium]